MSSTPHHATGNDSAQQSGIAGPGGAADPTPLSSDAVVPADQPDFDFGDHTATSPASLPGSGSLTPRGQRNAQMAAAYGAGTPIAAIAENWGVSEHVVRYTLKKRGIVVPTEPRSTRSPHAERNKKIVDLAEEGMSFTDIGVVFGLTRERVRQIVERDASKTAADFAETRADIALARREAQARELIATDPEMTIAEIRSHTGLSSAQVRALMSLAEAARRSQRESPKTGTERETIIEHLRTVAARQPGEPLSGPYYDAHRPDGSVSTMRVIQLFGTWSAAVHAAGLVAPVAPRAHYERRWSTEDMYGHVMAFLKAQLAAGASTSFRAYDEWSREVAEAPSGQTVRNQVGKWGQVRAEALRRIEAEDL